MKSSRQKRSQERARAIKDDIKLSRAGKKPNDPEREGKNDWLYKGVAMLMAGAMIGEPLKEGGQQTAEFLRELAAPAADRVWEHISPAQEISVVPLSPAEQKQLDDTLSDSRGLSTVSPEVIELSETIHLWDLNTPLPTSQLQGAKKLLTNPEDPGNLAVGLEAMRPIQRQVNKPREKELEPETI